MTHHGQIARKYVPEKIRRIIRATEKVEILQTQIDNISESVALDIIDGWSTGDLLLDFVLICCDGIYDPYVLTMQYRRLFDLGLRKPGQKVLLVQKAECFVDEDIIILRNVYLAELRPDILDVDVNSLSIKLPVKPGCLIWKEFYQVCQENGFLINGHKVHHDKWLEVGPIHNQYCTHGNAREAEKGIYVVPTESVCDIELLPEADPLALFQHHGIDQDLLNYLRETWIKELSSR